MDVKDPEEAIKIIEQSEEREKLIDDVLTNAMENGLPDSMAVIMMKGLRKWLRTNRVEVNWKQITLPSLETKVEDIMPSKEDIKDLLNIHNLSLRDKAFTLVSLSSGLRLGTLRSLKIGDINFEFEDPDVARIIVKRAMGRKIAKTMKFFVTFITPEAKHLLQQYIEWRKGRGEIITEESPLFTSNLDHQIGKFLSYAYLRIHWTRLLKRANLDHKANGSPWYQIHAHTLRKFFETQLINAQVIPAYREFWMGHKGEHMADSYFRPGTAEGSESRHLEEYRKAIPFLTIEEQVTTNHQKILTLEKQLEKRDLEIEKLKTLLDVLTQQVQDYETTIKEDLPFLKEQVEKLMKEREQK